MELSSNAIPFESDSALSSSNSLKPKPKDLSHHLTATTAARNASRVKDFYKYLSIPGITNLAGGMPSPEYFPFDTLESNVATAERFSESMNSQLLSLLRSKSSRLEIGKNSTDPNLLRRVDVSTTLQYTTAQGFAPLYTWIRDWAINHQHGGKIPYDSPEIILTAGNTDGFSKALQLVGDGARGDKLLVEEFTYMNAMQCAEPMGISIVPVSVDGEGMRPHGSGGLRDILENWDEEKDGKRPSLMYIIPTGQNPTGTNQSLKRRREIYALAQEFDIIIIEDDPYWYLQYDGAGNNNDSATQETTEEPKTTTTSPTKSSDSFLESLIPSYVTIDIDGRVIRLDTFSKTIAPGCRLGWIVASPLFIERILRIAETTTQAPSGLVQGMVAELLINKWGVDGWNTWLSCLREKYRERMEIMCTELRNGASPSIVREAAVTSAAARQRILDESVKEKYSTYHARISSISLNSTDTSPEEKTTAAAGDNPSSYTLLSTSPTDLYSFLKPAGGMMAWIHVNIRSHPAYDGTNAERLMGKLFEFLTTPSILVLAIPGNMFSPTEAIRAREGFEYLRLCFAAIPAEEVRNASRRFGEGVRKFWEEYDDDLNDD